MNVIHATTAHTRYDTRIFHRECVNLTDHCSVSLFVADNFEDEVVQKVNIKSVTKNKNRFIRVFFMTKALFSLNRKNSIIHLHDPELFLVAIILKIFRFKVVVDIHEDFAKQIYLKNYIPNFLKPIFSRLYIIYEKFILTFVDFAVVCTPSFLNRKKSILVGNYMSQNEISSLRKAQSEDIPKTSSFIYSGALSEERGLFNLLDLAEKLKISNTKLIIAGTFANEELEAKAMLHDGWSNVDYLGYVDRESLLQIQKSCKAGVILFNNVGQYNLASSVKLFEYLACELPILMPDFGEWVELNKTYNLGYNTQTDNINTKIIDSLISHNQSQKYRDGVNKFFEKFSLDKCIIDLVLSYREIFKYVR